MQVDQVIEQVRQFARENGLAKATLARMAGLGINTLRAMDEPDWSPTVATLRKLEALAADSDTGDPKHQRVQAGP